MNISPRNCPSCDGCECVEGNFNFDNATFIPRGSGSFFGFKVLGAVCLDCGHIQHYVEGFDLTLLQEKARGSAAPPP